MFVLVVRSHRRSALAAAAAGTQMRRRTQARGVRPQTEHSVVVHLVPHTVKGLHGLVHLVHHMGRVLLRLNPQIPPEMSLPSRK